MKQKDNRWAIAIVAGVVSVMTCVLIAASSNATYGAVLANETLTPTAWVYLPYISREEPPTPTPTPTSAPTLTPTSTPTSIPTPTPTTAPEVIVLSSSAFVPYSGSDSWYIVGEVLNNTGSNVDFVRINATLRDSSGNVVGSDYSYSMIDTLSPSMISPFRVIFSDPPTWSSYDLVVTWDTTSQQPYPLEVLNSTSYFDNYDGYHVVGEVENQYSEQRTFVKAFVTLYDINGEVIGVEYSYTNPDELSPGQTASFDTEVYFWKGKPNRNEVASHLLQVYDD
jgi:hypothetical protein